VLNRWPMTDTPQMDRKEILKARLGVLQVEHRDLDTAIKALEEKSATDMLTLRRMKKKKLALKDEITRLEDEITPDIIA